MSLTQQVTILLVDDDPDFLDFAQVLLEQSGYRDVVRAHNGEQAWDMLTKNPSQFHILITDYMMPGLDGLTLIEQMNQHPDLVHIKKIVASGYGTPQLVDMALSLGVYRWFDKPLDQQMLKKTLGELS